jgi:hypothetical protein
VVGIQVSSADKFGNRVARNGSIGKAAYSFSSLVGIHRMGSNNRDTGLAPSRTRAAYPRMNPASSADGSAVSTATHASRLQLGNGERHAR